MDKIIETFKQCYSEFSQQSLDLLPSVYGDSVVFQDPIHRVEGLDALHRYFSHTMKGVERCQFEFDSVFSSGQMVAVEWHMRFRHRKLRGGKEIVFPGASVLKVEDKVVSHTDYYDMGAMLYENIPLLGWGVKSIKSKLAEN